jgi:hypothetical protein
MEHGMMPPQFDQETLPTTTYQLVDQSMPMADLGTFDFPEFSSSTSTAPAMEDGLMPLQIDQEIYQEPLPTITYQLVDQSLPMADLGSFGFPEFSSSKSAAPAMEQMPLQMDFTEFSSSISAAPAMEQKPLQSYQETCAPEQSVEFSTEPPVMDQESGMPTDPFCDVDDDPVMRQLLESMLDDYATAAPADLGFGDD